MRTPLPESPPEAAGGPSVEVIIPRLFPLIKVPAFLFVPGVAAAPEPRTPGLSQREGAGAVSSPTGGTGRRRWLRGTDAAGVGSPTCGAKDGVPQFFENFFQLCYLVLCYIYQKCMASSYSLNQSSLYCKKVKYVVMSY